MSGEDPTVAGVVLAGGDSTRFRGGHKALATLAGEPLLARVVRSVDAVADGDPVVAVRGEAQADRLRPALAGASVRTATDDPSFSGPLAGLYGALEAVEAPWIFLCGCDMPLVSPSAIDHLATHRRAGVDAVVPRQESDRDAEPGGESGGDPEPLHALYRRRALEAARSELPSSGGVRSLLPSLDVEWVAVDESHGLAESVANVNTRAELQRIERGHRSQLPTEESSPFGAERTSIEREL